jgi:hypothetical protein
MIEINTEQATEKLKALQEDLSKRQIAKAIVRALNYAAARVDTKARRSIGDKYNIKSSEIAKTTKVQSANPKTLTANILAQYGTLSLSVFNPKEVSVSGGSKILTTKSNKAYSSKKIKNTKKSTGIYIEIIKGNKQYIPSAFMGFWNKTTSDGTKRASGGAIFARGRYGSSGFEFSKGNDSISKLKSKSVYWAILNKDVGPKTEENGIEVYYTRLNHELTKGLRYAK